MTDERSYETMADEHAAWLGKTVGHAVWAVLEHLGRDRMLAAGTVESVEKAVCHATRESFLAGARAVEIQPSVGAEQLKERAEEHALAANRNAWEWLFASWGKLVREFMVESVAKSLFKDLVGPNCVEMYHHGAKHARRRLADRKGGVPSV